LKYLQFVIKTTGFLDSVHLPVF